MKIEIFKAYDIRGIYPKEINEEAAFKIGQAFYHFLLQTLKKKPSKILLARDNRLSSPSLAKSFSMGVRSQGGKIINLGIIPTPTFYFASWYLKADGGAMITASHNPPEFNGIKLVGKNAKPIAKGAGMEKIKSLVKKLPKISKIKKGKEEKKSILNEYLKFSFKFLDKRKVLPLKIVIDTANAVAGLWIPFLKRNLKQITFYHLFEKLDGRFPNHLPDPLKKENLKFLSEKVKEVKADFGVAFDGDGDRIIFVDENGNPVSGDIITALLSKIILEKNPGQKILYDIRSSKIVKETIEENGGKAYLCKTGHSFIKLKMAKYNIYFGGEVSGHYYLKDNHFMEMPLFVLFKVIEKLSEERKPFSQVLKPFQKYFSSGEINFEMEERREVVEALKKYFKKLPCKISTLDGVKAEFDDFWVLVRPSNTEPLLRLMVEAKSKEILDKKTKEMKALILKTQKEVIQSGQD